MGAAKMRRDAVARGDDDPGCDPGAEPVQPYRPIHRPSYSPGSMLAALAFSIAALAPAPTMKRRPR